MEKCPPLNLAVVAIEKVAIGSPSTKVDNFTYYFKSNLTQRGYRKRLIEICLKSVKFNTSQRYAEQTSKKDLLSDLKILELWGQLSFDDYVPDKYENEWIKIRSTDS